MSGRGIRRAGVLSCLLAAAVALVPPTTAYADGIRAKQWALEALHTEEVWQTTKGGGVTVAVLDTGVESDHPDLDGNVLTGKDMVGFGAGPGDRAWARHGTAMAGIIAGHGHGSGNGDGVMGIAPEAKILPVRVILEDGDPSRTKARNTRGNALAEGIRWAADQGADVINLSLGDDSASAHPEPAEDEAVQYALKKGSVASPRPATAARRATASPIRRPTRASSPRPPSTATAPAPPSPPAAGTPRSAPPASTSSSPTRTTSTTRAGAPRPPRPSSPAPSPSSGPPTRT